MQKSELELFGLSLKVLIAEDSTSDRMLLGHIIKNEGHIVFEAEDGEQAIALFKELNPDIVLLDALMPNVDGFEAAKKIKLLAGEKMVPIIFLTSLKDAADLAQCLDSGGDDFISKPYNKVILAAKMKALTRMCMMHETMLKQRDLIAVNHQHLVHEQEVAKKVFDNVAHSGNLNAKNIKYLLSPLAVFNGDVLLAARRPSGGMMVLLGDFTGHGLPAAIGAMPMAEIFYGMVNKGFSLQDVIREINSKLKKILPVGIFCCACMVEISFFRKSLSVWIGGLPDCYLYRSKHKQREKIPSRHLPLGVLDNRSFNDDAILFEVDNDDRLYLWSDGIIESRNTHGEMFGNEGVERIFDSNDDPDQLFDEIQKGVSDFMGEMDRDDDFTILELGMVDEEELDEVDCAVNVASISGPLDWGLDYELRSQTLKNFNPLPLLLHILLEVPGLRQSSGQIYTVLTELYSNALEHGILGLSSSLKSTPEGFSQYYQQRDKLLSDMKDGCIKIRFDHTPTTEGGCLYIRVEDSGKGFNYLDKIDNQHKTEGFCGRGIPLVRTICKSIQYKGEGNIVEAVIQWKRE